MEGGTRWLPIADSPAPELPVSPDEASQARELELREKEIVAREHEVTAREKEVKMSPWLNLTR